MISSHVLSLAMNVGRAMETHVPASLVFMVPDTPVCVIQVNELLLVLRVRAVLKKMNLHVFHVRKGNFKPTYFIQVPLA